MCPRRMGPTQDFGPIRRSTFPAPQHTPLHRLTGSVHRKRKNTGKRPATALPASSRKRWSREPSRARMEPHSTKRPAKQPTETDRDDRTPVSSNGFSLRRSSLSERPAFGPSEPPNDKTLPCATYADRRAGPKPKPAGHRPRSTHAPRESARAADRRTGGRRTYGAAGREATSDPPFPDLSRATAPFPSPAPAPRRNAFGRSRSSCLRGRPTNSGEAHVTETTAPTAKKTRGTAERRKNGSPRTRKRASGNSGRPFVSAGSAP